MNIWYVVVLVVYAFAMSCGQILFKMAANFGSRAQSPSTWFHSYVNPYFILGLCFYFGLTFLWVWLIKFVPLSRAYPVLSLCFVITPLLAGQMLGETVPRDLPVATILIVSGVYLIARQ